MSDEPNLKHEQARWPEWLTIASAAAYAEISQRHLRNLARQPGFPMVRIGRLVRVHRPAFDAWMARQGAVGHAVDQVLAEVRSRR